MRPIELLYGTFVLFLAIRFMVIYYSNNRKIIQGSFYFLAFMIDTAVNMYVGRCVCVLTLSLFFFFFVLTKK